MNVQAGEEIEAVEMKVDIKPMCNRLIICECVLQSKPMIYSYRQQAGRRKWQWWELTVERLSRTPLSSADPETSALLQGLSVCTISLSAPH